MYPSTNNLGNTTPTSFSFTTNNPFPPDNNNNNSTTIFDHSTSPNFSSFHPIHSPCSFYEEDLQLHFQEYFLHQQQQQQETTVMTSMENHTDEDGPVNIIQGSGLVLCNNSTSTTSNKQIPRKRTSKKDRHSKINTLQGPRDRRMRLSLDVAKKFFGLQDMLGFDKASKTVHWLLTKSKTAIKHLTNNSSRSGGGNNSNNLGSNTASVSSTSNNSECEVLSGIINDDSSLSLPREVTTTEKVKPRPREKRVATTKASRGSRAFNPLAKETREKARARARERTKEKRIRLGNGNNYNNNQVIKKMTCIEGMDQSLNRHLRSWSPFEASGGEESSTQVRALNNIHPSFLQTDYQEAASQRQHKQGSVNDHSNLFNAPVTWSASPSSSYHQNAAIYHENQFTEFQSFVNPWDHQAYNN